LNPCLSLFPDAFYTCPAFQALSVLNIVFNDAESEAPDQELFAIMTISVLSAFTGDIPFINIF
jgi:hypothetical protein